MSKELIEKINALGLKKRKIETDLDMPLNSLSGMLKGNRVIPLKWQIKLSEYVDNHNPNKKPVKTTDEPKKETLKPPQKEEEKQEKKIDLSDKDDFLNS